MPILSRKEKTLYYLVESRFEEIDRICVEVQNLLSEQGLDAEAFEVILILREGLVNAVEHGNGLKECLDIECSVRLRGDRIVIHVRDQGPGFDWKTLLARESDPLSIRGRGMTILKTYASRMRFNSRGNQLTLIKEFQR